MKKLLIALSLMITTISFGQWAMPARQVSVSTQEWSVLKSTNGSAQATFNFIDKYLTTGVTASNIVIDASRLDPLLLNCDSNYVPVAVSNAQQIVNNVDTWISCITNQLGALDSLSSRMSNAEDRVSTLEDAQDNLYYLIPITNGVATIDYTNGHHQALDVTENTMLYWNPAPMIEVDDLVLWIQGHADYWFSNNTENIILDTNRYTSASVSNVLVMSRYYSSPWSTSWRQENIFPRSESSSIGPPVVPGTNWCASGGTITTGVVGGITYRFHTFTSDGTFSVSCVTSTPAKVEVLIVGAGGGGGGEMGGGGGGGQVIAKLLASGSAVTVTNGASYPVVVGVGGGAGVWGLHQGYSGSESSIFGITAVGGGGGGSRSDSSITMSGKKGACGGGAAAQSDSGKYGIPGQGYAGGNGGFGAWQAAGGGGGASHNGITALQRCGGAGGDGFPISFISNTPTYYAGGGGGGFRCRDDSCRRVHSPGGKGGGGYGGLGGDCWSLGTKGTDNTGGGGGGGGYSISSGHAGGSGIVIVRYPINP